ncbi:MAG: hypothetical protein AAFY71_09395 [Bacteroidota bacterium]
MKKTSPNYYKKWKWMAPLGLAMIGMGLSLTGEATIMKGQEAVWWSWVAMGTLGLVILNAGVSIFGSAVQRQMWKDLAEREQDS